VRVPVGRVLERHIVMHEQRWILLLQMRDGLPIVSSGLALWQSRLSDQLLEMWLSFLEMSVAGEFFTQTFAMTARPVF